MKSSSTRLILFGTFVLIPLAASGENGLQESRNWQVHISELRQNLPNFFSPQNAPTEPEPVVKVLPEWAPSSTLLLGITLYDTMFRPEVFNYYLALIKIATQYVDVCVVIGKVDAREVDRFISRLQREGLTQESLNRLHFIEGQGVDYWIRDYGPLFGLNPDGDLLAFDNSYRELTDEREFWLNVPQDVISPDMDYDYSGLEAHKKATRNREIVPLYIAKYIRQSLQVNCDLVRPPLYLQGGDHITDGRGRFFVSEDTVIANGGNLKLVGDVFRDYFGAQELLVLNSFPGISPRHLDVLVKLTNSESILLADPPLVTSQSNKYNQRISAEIGSIQEKNEHYLKLNAPDLKIVRVPMLPLLEQDLEAFKRRVRGQIIAYSCQELGINYLQYFYLKESDPVKQDYMNRIAAHWQDIFNKPMALDHYGDLDKLAQHYLNADLRNLLDTNADTKTIYRSYINSLFIENDKGKSAWLLPRFKARNGESADYIAECEKEVEKSYRSSTPNADVHWLDADVMVNQLGAIHCTTLLIPISSSIHSAKRLYPTIPKRS